MGESFTKDQIIFQSEQPLQSLLLILKGKVRASFPGGELLLQKGDILGICEIGFDSYLMTYTALTDLSAVSYPISGLDSLETLFQSFPDLASLCAVSICNQVHALTEQYIVMEYRCGGLYQTCIDRYAKYQVICGRNNVKVRSLPGLGSLSPYFNEEPPEDFLCSFYEGLYQIFSHGEGTAFSKEPAVIIGLVGKAVTDSGHILDAFKAMADYESIICQLYMNEDLLDFFDMYTALYLKLGQDSPDSALLMQEIEHIIQYLEHTGSAEHQFVSVRISDFTNRLSSLQTFSQSSLEDASAKSKAHEAFPLTNSLDLILDYSGIENETAVIFKNLISRYKALSDKSAADDSTRKLRQNIAQTFYALYSLIFQKSLTDTTLPVPIKMFLYFGYIDEELAGPEHASYLNALAESMSQNTTAGIYTLYDWLVAIYEGKKEPSRNEFDQDYGEYLRYQKSAGKLTEAQEKELLNDRSKHVEYELQNMFPLVNKMTYGRISSFCPVFSEHNVLKDLSSSYVSAAAIKEALNKIRSMDYSAFYRETIYSNESIGVFKEYIHVECQPDFILMPNIGSRGVMWQEIEGKRRTTSSRMMLSIFELEDLYSTMVRLTGEYRWEMCRRVQGARWNDIASRSITSEYFDYIQFYRKNHDLSTDAKEKVKTSLQKSKNSYKEMFVRDYILWILFEGTGSPRLNKVARSILFTYCPFSAPVRDTLTTNPIYKELLDRYQFSRGQRRHHLDNLTTKISNSGSPVPDEIVKEFQFTEK